MKRKKHKKKIIYEHIRQKHPKNQKNKKNDKKHKIKKLVKFYTY